jgi:hypothetical protein
MHYGATVRTRTTTTHDTPHRVEIHDHYLLIGKITSNTNWVDALLILKWHK